MSGVELFERAAAAGGQLLKVERSAVGGGEGSAAAFLLTFDVGRILVAPEADGQGLRLEHVVARGDAPEELGSADEEEPWWRLLGHPVVRVDAESASALRLQFRHDADSPRTIELRAEGGRVRARLVGR